MTRSSRTWALGLLAVGGAAGLLGATRPWVVLRSEDALTEVSVEVTGASVAPLSAAVSVVGLAAVLAVPSVRGWLRRGVGLVVLALALLALVDVVAVALDLAARARSWWAVEVAVVADQAQADVTLIWPVLTALGLLGVAGGALLVVLRGGQWSGLSARYERRTSPSPAADASSGQPRGSSADAWQALDRGEDPTESS